jgi:hypothetical protein
MMIVAGPVRAWSASSWVGLYSLLVEYSVHLPISQPARRPTITDTATPMWLQPRSSHVSTSEAPTTAIVDRLMPLARAASRAFCEESSCVRTWKMPHTESRMPTAAIAIGRNRAAICMR